MNIRSLLLKASKLRNYFMRGHSQWFSYVISLVNFVTISFYLLIENLTIFPANLMFRHYLLIFILIYTPLAIIIGYLDMTRGTFRVEQRMAKELSPLWMEVFQKFEQIENNQKLIMEHLKLKNTEE